MKTAKVILVFLCALAVLSMFDAFYTVSEYEQAAILQFENPVRSVKEAGLHFKIPLVQRVAKFEKRILRWNGDSGEISTRDNMIIRIEVTARWKIVDPMTFIKAIGTYDQAYAKLDDIMDSIAKDTVAANPLVELVRSSDQIKSVPGWDSGDKFTTNDAVPGEKVVLGRDAVARRMLAGASKSISSFGMGLVDVQVKRLHYGEKVKDRVYARMISERKYQAAQLISEGEGKKAEITGRMGKDLQAIRSEAFKTAEEIKGKADAEVTRIYGKSYNQDPEFYSFYKTLETYKQTSFDNTTLILSTDYDFFKVLKGTSKK